MVPRRLEDALAELRRCLPSRRRLGKSPDAAAALARLLADCHPVSVEEKPGAVIVRLRVDDEPAMRLTCVLHHPPSRPLTAAEAAVAECLCEGRTLAQVARLRGVSVNTIKSQVRHIFRKLEVDSRVALVRRLGP